MVSCLQLWFYSIAYGTHAIVRMSEEMSDWVSGWVDAAWIETASLQRPSNCGVLPYCAIKNACYSPGLLEHFLHYSLPHPSLPLFPPELCFTTDFPSLRLGDLTVSELIPIYHCHYIMCYINNTGENNLCYYLWLLSYSVRSVLMLFFYSKLSHKAFPSLRLFSQIILSITSIGWS